jgi:hypothetical protein
MGTVTSAPTSIDCGATLLNLRHRFSVVLTAAAGTPPLVVGRRVHRQGFTC